MERAAGEAQAGCQRGGVTRHLNADALLSELPHAGQRGAVKRQQLIADGTKTSNHEGTKRWERRGLS